MYGGWDLMIETYFTSLEDLRKIITFCRNDPDLKQWIDNTTTLIGVKHDFNLT